MSQINIQDLLPDPNILTYNKLKSEYPFNILSRYAKAIGEKYPKKLEGIISASADATNENLIGYVFYILAAIGRGYSYRLLEVVQTTAEMYPLKVTLFEPNPQDLPLVSDYIAFENILNTIIRRGFTQTLLINLVAQVDLYNESRSEKFG